MRLPSVVQFGLAVGIVTGLVCGPLVPPEHVHAAGMEGRTRSLVHSHPSYNAGTPSGHTSLTPPHGDHNRALYLTAVYDRMSRLVPQPVVPVVVIDVTPQLRPLATVQATAVSSTHGPPRSTSVTRGPPRLS